jgi:hypothetical protein
MYSKMVFEELLNPVMGRSTKKTISPGTMVSMTRCTLDIGVDDTVVPSRHRFSLERNIREAKAGFKVKVNLKTYLGNLYYTAH